MSKLTQGSEISSPTVRSILESYSKAVATIQGTRAQGPIQEGAHVRVGVGRDLVLSEIE